MPSLSDPEFEQHVADMLSRAHRLRPLGSTEVDRSELEAFGIPEAWIDLFERSALRALRAAAPGATPSASTLIDTVAAVVAGVIVIGGWQMNRNYGLPSPAELAARYDQAAPEGAGPLPPRWP